MQPRPSLLFDVQIISGRQRVKFMRLIRITESSIYPMRFRFHERWHLAFCQSPIWCERRCNGGRLARVSCCGKPGELTKLQASVTAAERENQQRWDGLQRVQPGSNPELGVEFEHELMPLCLREYNINGFHEGWKGHCAKKKKVGQLCDAETTYSGNFLRDIVLKCNVNVPIVNIIVLADLKWLLCNSEGLKVPGNEKCLLCRVTLWAYSCIVLLPITINQKREEKIKKCMFGFFPLNQTFFLSHAEYFWFQWLEDIHINTQQIDLIIDCQLHQMAVFFFSFKTPNCTS